MANPLKSFAGNMLPALEQEMRAVLAAAEGSAPDRFYGMLHYHMGWVDANLQPTEVANGKRIRPLLCLLACQAAAESVQVLRSSREHLTPEHPSASSGQALNTQAPDTWTPVRPAAGRHLNTQSPEHLIALRQALPAAAAIELLHNFSLIHDDIEDASPTRRGRATLWKIWGVEQAINSGDALFALAHLALNRLIDRGVGAEIVVRAWRRFDETCLRLTQGQHADMDFEARDEVSVAEYVEMITGKTAVLLSLCAELGALIGGAVAEVVAHYAAFGRDLGLAFQVKDDILGIWGNEDRIGKSAATDIVTRKKTLPILYALSQSPQLRQLYRQPQTDNGFVQQAVHLLDKTGARDFASAKASDYSQSALDHLEAAEPTGDAGDALYELAHMLLNRDF